MRRKPIARCYENSWSAPTGWDEVLPLGPTLRGMLAPTLFLLVLGLRVGGFWAAGCKQASAQPDLSNNRYVLSVPGSSQPLHLAVALPRGARGGFANPWQLIELGVSKPALPARLVHGTTDTGLADEKNLQLLAAIPAGKPSTSPRHFRLIATGAVATLPRPKAPPFRFKEVKDRALVILEGDKQTLRYNHGTVTGAKVPEKDPRRQRSSYIHPLWGVHGEVLTDDFPPDHYHHHGLFWTWPRVEIAGQSYDLWTDLGIKQRFVRWLGRDAGPLGARLGVENGWFVADQKVMIERLWVDVYPTQGNCQALDLHFTWIPIEHPIRLQGAAGKSYGGLTMRFAIKNRADATITTPAGVATDDLPDTPLPWADMTATFAGQASPSGAALLVPPDHPNYPPTWLLRHYGPLCIGWPGVKAKSFPAGQPIHLNYRVWIHDGQLTAARIGQAYQAFVEGLSARWVASRP